MQFLREIRGVFCRSGNSLATGSFSSITTTIFFGTNKPAKSSPGRRRCAGRHRLADVVPSIGGEWKNYCVPSRPMGAPLPPMIVRPNLGADDILATVAATDSLRNARVVVLKRLSRTVDGASECAPGRRHARSRDGADESRVLRRAGRVPWPSLPPGFSSSA